MVETHRVRSPEERRRLELARRRHARRFKRIEALKRRGPQFIMVLLTLLGIALILYRLFGPELLRSDSENIRDTFEGTVAARAASDVRVDPDLLQSEIEAFETVLFGGGDSSGLRELGLSISTEASALGRSARGLSPDWPRLAELEQGLNAIASDAETGFNLDVLETLRGDWLAVRSQTFHRADWFAAGVVAPQQDSSQRAAYRDAASSLLSLVESARYEAESFSERVAEGENIRADWRDFESDFSSQLREVELTIPAERPRSGASRELLAAIQQLEQAIDFARERVAVETPRNPLNRRDYDRAVDTALDAVDAFDSLSD